MKHLARASSCLYVAAYSPSSTFILSFSLSSCFFLSLYLSLSSTLLPSTRALGESLSSEYPPDVCPLHFEFLTRFPSQISLSSCLFHRMRTISSKRCSVIRHGFRENTDFCSFFPPLSPFLPSCRDRSEMAGINMAREVIKGNCISVRAARCRRPKRSFEN